VICAKCGERKKVSKRDPDFCQECFDAIEYARNTIMQRTDAAVGYNRHTNGGRKINVAAFLSIFHPEMSDQRMRTIVNAVEEDKP
jgi:hypothetical protein